LSFEFLSFEASFAIDFLSAAFVFAAASFEFFGAGAAFDAVVFFDGDGVALALVFVFGVGAALAVFLAGVGADLGFFVCALSTPVAKLKAKKLDTTIKITAV
jgi:hypothetical protein